MSDQPAPQFESFEEPAPLCDFVEEQLRAMGIDPIEAWLSGDYCNPEVCEASPETCERALLDTNYRNPNEGA